MNKYRDDNFEYFPPWTMSATIPSATWNWAWALKKDYKLNVKVFSCPSAAMLTSSNIYLTDAGNNLASSFYYSNYGYNYMYIGSSIRIPPLPGPTYTSAKMSQLRHPSTTLLTVDACNSVTTPTISYCVVDDGGLGVLNFHDRHNSGANILWTDGHASYEKNSWNRIQKDPSKKYFSRK
jgi:prepilin-type processing-associated H-X9-DG protein